MSRTKPKSVTKSVAETVTESKPLQAVAGAGDLAAEKLRDLSAKAADKFATIEADPTATSNRIQADLESRAEALGSVLRSTSVEVRTQLEGLSVKAQDALHTAFQQAGETYDALAERGKDVVVKFAGEEHSLEVAGSATATKDTEPASKPRKSTPKKQTATHARKSTAKPSTTTRKTARTTKKSGS